MAEQNFKNHSRYIPLWHLITSLLIAGALGGSIVTFVHSDGNLRHAAFMMILICIVLVLLFWYARWFALRAQDRAIRAEENFRHYLLTGQPLDKNLRLGQIIALRFASDEEFPALAKKAVEEKLQPKQIKQAVQHWKADRNRV
jgi:high-affinity Fe2+/Pb2+ permease